MLFLGQGLLLPFQRDLKQDFANAGGVELVKACVKLVLGTQANSEFAEGELPWRPEFGSRLYLLRHQKNGPMLTAMATVYVTEALARWEPRVLLRSVRATFDNSQRALQIRVLYDVIDKNTPANNVVFADVDQDVSVALG